MCYTRTLEIDSGEPAVYVIEEYETELFAPAYFEIRPFGYYVEVWPRTNEPSPPRNAAGGFLPNSKWKIA